MVEMVYTTYEAVKSQIRTGDCIVWNGNGHNSLERLYSIGIRLFTGPVTHISTAIWADYRSGYFTSVPSLQIWESVVLGQLFDSLDRRIAQAKEENWLEAWWFPLSEKRRAYLNQQAMVDYMLRKCEVGTKYDVRQAFKSAFDKRSRGHTLPNDDALFCSESHMFALLEGGAVTGCNPSEAHPTDVIEFNIHGPTYYQIFGEKKELPNVGTVEADNWDQ
jgi:hypothetical protein